MSDKKKAAGCPVEGDDVCLGYATAEADLKTAKAKADDHRTRCHCFDPDSVIEGLHQAIAKLEAREATKDAALREIREVVTAQQQNASYKLPIIKALCNRALTAPPPDPRKETRALREEAAQRFKDGE